MNTRVIATMETPAVLIHPTEFPPGPGGIGTHAYALARGLASYGFQVRVVTPTPYATEAKVCEFAAKEPFLISTLPYRSPRFFEGALRLRCIIAELCALRGRKRAVKPCTIVSGSQALWVGWAASLFTGLPMLAVVHGSELDSRIKWERILTGLALRRADAVVAVSRFTAQYLSRFGVRPEQVHVIPNGADASFFGCVANDSDAKRSFRQKLALGDGPVLLTVGNVGPRKGQEVVIRALPEIRKHFPGVMYVAVGLPTFAKEYQRLAAELGVVAHVRFLGVATPTELREAYYGSDLFVMVSRHTTQGDFEGFGIAVVEAALCGLPSVVTRDSGLVEAIEEGTTGVAVDQDDPEATASAIICLLSNPGRLREMGECARARALRSQTWNTVIPSYAALVRKLIGAVP